VKKLLIQVSKWLVKLKLHILKLFKVLNLSFQRGFEQLAEAFCRLKQPSALRGYQVNIEKKITVF
jgi:hypothetical protein